MFNWLKRVVGGTNASTTEQPTAPTQTFTTLSQGVGTQATPPAQRLSQENLIGSWAVIFGPDSESNLSMAAGLAKTLHGGAIVPVEKAGDLLKLHRAFQAEDSLDRVMLMFNHHINGVERAVGNEEAKAWSIKMKEQFERMLNQTGAPFKGLAFKADWNISVSTGSASVQFFWPSIPAKTMCQIAQLLEESYARCCKSVHTASNVTLAAGGLASGPGVIGAVGPKQLEALASGRSIEARILDLRSTDERRIEADAQAGVSLGLEIDAIVDELVEIGREEEFISMEPGGKFDDKRKNVRARRLGTRLNEMGGMPLMQAVHYRVRNRLGGGLARELESAWGYIGDWRP
jgi:hypothetical protein